MDDDYADLDAAAQRLMDRAAEVAATAKSTGGGNPFDETVRCPECLDRAWILTSDEDATGTPTMKPCRLCAPVAKRRWQEGHWKGPDPCPCEECALTRTGQLKVGRDVDPITGLVRPGVLREDDY